MAVPIVAEAGQGLNHGADLPAHGAKSRPVPATEDPDHGRAEGGRDVHGPGVVADVDSGEGKHGAQLVEFPIGPQPAMGRGPAARDRLGLDLVEQRFFRHVAHDHDGQDHAPGSAQNRRGAA